ncbi:hypothetical protein [Saccharicrinis fermentans]|uniref:Uncharacterized protein n=1 Tax=Saccharicrinis fermentans DSM 9555 = JCM 21142 TaxID=869213 RepID=W7YD41_9BACT|nr:hypothetical protein [Saccharicrinis fermentans]GAF05408.1 hypothetical protein JCM21142_104142 [Saccharicrinis fermentans DSM 9555 = JCM 21142]
MHFNIPNDLRNKVNNGSQLLLLLRVEPSDANPMEYPLPIGDKKRSLGILLNVSELTYADDKQDKRVKIKPIDDLLKPNTWRKR